jgi:hypothetical protein
MGPSDWPPAITLHSSVSDWSLFTASESAAGRAYDKLAGFMIRPLRERALWRRERAAR